ncbi:dihydrolipoamide acetyltransferase family protein [Cryobacterium sp. PH31-AA6]|uniref:dihydrolipoamide acetyltransferase family protein n=1 Tax=Cryobacterium sp. PH31-AA6 TaxID=3046205 RepID=UPI0024BA093B|nr:dihydrolipoamide acetyltransferase family protein [Cryobacterium sp. PH31-AA6]MDJ0324629.1 dihydrolipoamide acetyltransferase family protein [Cryobacterium sp. PH31-AA6]
MATLIRMPEVLANSEEAAIQSWLVSLGQVVTVGMPLAEVETEKAIVEYAAETEGTVLRLLVREGEPVTVGTPIAIVGAEGENIDDVLGDSPDVAAAPDTVPTPDEAPLASVAVEVTGNGGQDSSERRFVSPLVRRLVKERGLNLSGVRGTGPGGRIVRRDIEGIEAMPAAQAVLAAAAPAPSAPATAIPTVAAPTGTEVPHTAMRRAIARRLTESKSTVPHFYLVADCRVDKLLALRSTVNSGGSVKVSLNDFVIKAAASAFQEVPEANATWGETAVHRHDGVDMSVAVGIDGGLVTPVLRSVQTMSLTEVSRSVADLAERARAGKLRQHELEGGSFAVSNLGMYGVTEFSAIINPPQSAILAVGVARPMPVVTEDGVLGVGAVMTVTLSADHRVLDGVLAAQWLGAFVRRIENPITILI